MAFTKEQMLAINADNSNIIVSAGAGSGKTAVLTERVIRKLKEGIDVDRLLVLTFTNEAANEMKNRIRESIIKNKLSKQLDLLEQAYITTFDSFALSLVKKYNYLLNVSDNLKIAGSNVILIYKYRVLDEIFEGKYGEDRFDKLINDFCLKHDKSIKDFVINVSNKLDLLVDKEGYINSYYINFFNDDKINDWLIEYEEIISSKINELRELYSEITNYIDHNLISKLDAWFKPLFDGHNYDEYKLFMTFSTVSFTKLDSEGLELKEAIKKVISEIKELLRFSSREEIITSIKETYDYVKEILDIICKLDSEVVKYKDKHNVYEFNDISHMAIKLVKDNLLVRDELKNYFNEIMVDEYQDTSSVQEEFLSYIENNNLYMVGDIKQSIYRFRNANPYIFHKKYQDYSKGNGGIKIDLIKNFRSRHEVLDNINEIFNLIMDDDIGNANYQLEHNMVYGNTNYDNEDTGANNNLEIYNYHYDKDDEYTREEKELFIISEDINNKIKNKYQVFDKKTGLLRDIKYSDICIITDRNKYLPEYKKILEYHGIPSVIYMDSTLNNDTVVLVIKNLIDLVWHVKNMIYDGKFRYLFTSVARSFLFEYKDDEIYEILKDKVIDDKIIGMACEIDINTPITECISDILDKFMVYDNLTKLANINENIIKISNLIQISDDISNLGYSISQFIDYLDEVSNLDLTVKYSVVTSGEDAVKIMNIHKSKGLEFSLCYYPGMHNEFTFKEVNRKLLFSSHLGIIMPYLKDSEFADTILRDIYKADYYKEEISEKIRLLYVALTRCREKMIIVTSLQDSDGYNYLVPSKVRLKYRSFLDILNSIKVISKYVTLKDVRCSHEYQKVILKEINEDECDIMLDKREVDCKCVKLSNMKFSKNRVKLINDEEARKLDYGTKIHQELEYADFKECDNIYIKNLLSQIDNNFINTYHEYEFCYLSDGVKYNGVIDLMIEYDDKIYIIDYKLKDILDSEYTKQLAGYKEYITLLTKKEIKTYLYSVIDGTLKEVL